MPTLIEGVYKMAVISGDEKRSVGGMGGEREKGREGVGGRRVEGLLGLSSIYLS
jgi:hypothetical protein